MRYDGSSQSTVVTHTLNNLSVGRTYTITVTAINLAGESLPATTTATAASVPPKMGIPTLLSADATTITIQWAAPSFNGGSSITSYAVRRDDGPLSSF